MRWPQGIDRARLVLILWTASWPIWAATVYENGFEGADGAPPEDWRFAIARGRCSGRWDDEYARSGKRSLRLKILDDETARAHWRLLPRIPLKPATAYRLRVDLLALNITGEAYVIAYENGFEGPSHWHHTRKSKGSHDWRTQEISFTSREDAEWLRIVLKLRHGTGYAWFDNLVLEELPEAATDSAPRVRQAPSDDGSGWQIMWTPAQWTQHGALHVTRGHVNALSFFPRRNRDDAADEPVLVVETSPGIRMIGPVCRGRGPTPAPMAAEPDLVAEKHEGSRLRRRFSIPVKETSRTHLADFHWTEYRHLYAEVDRNVTAPFIFRWRIETGEAAGPWHELDVTVTDDVPPSWRSPDTFRMYVQHTGGLRHPDREVRAQVVRWLKTAGIRGGFSMTHYEPDKSEVDRQLAELGFEMHAWRFEGLRGAPDTSRAAVDRQGERSDHHWCPQAQVEADADWLEGLQAYYRQRLASGLKRLIIDYEPRVSEYCYCVRCRQAFAASEALDQAVIERLSPAEIRQRHTEAWGRFRAAQHAAIVKRHIAVIHGIGPGVDVGLCSWPGTAAAARNGADITLFEPDAAFHAPMIYRRGLVFHDLVEETCRRTRAPVVPFIELSDISQPRSLTPHELSMNLLACGLSGGQGGFIWVGMECLDAQYLAGIRDAVRRIQALRQVVDWHSREPTWIRARPEHGSLDHLRVDGRDIEVRHPEKHPHLRLHRVGDARDAAVAVLNYSDTQPEAVILETDTPAVFRRLWPSPEPLASSSTRIRLDVDPSSAVAVLMTKQD